MPTKLTIEILTAAIDGFEFQKRKIDFHIASLRAMLSGNPAKPGATPEAAKPKRKLSRAGRAAIIAATKRRWALKRAEAAKAKPAAKKSVQEKKAA